MSLHLAPPRRPTILLKDLVLQHIAPSRGACPTCEVKLMFPYLPPLRGTCHACQLSCQ
ncbi:hypothetical protein BDZ91DRAFT_713715 [Kalaharituber pfeilii]|nr:hypothetical protein BDZ91DRAFT_713715 [Kalaharituber pfeilii]